MIDAAFNIADAGEILFQIHFVSGADLAAQCQGMGPILDSTIVRFGISACRTH
jgi:hypothetical protein